MFRSPTAVVVWIVWLLFAVGNWIDLAVQGRDHASAVAAAILLLATGAAYVTAQRPRIIADETGVTVRNPLRDHRIGWAGVAKVDLADLLRVHCQLGAARRTRPASLAAHGAPQGHQRLGRALLPAAPVRPPRPGPAARPGPRGCGARPWACRPAAAACPTAPPCQAPKPPPPRPKRRRSSGCSASARPRPRPRPSGPAARRRPRRPKPPGAGAAGTGAAAETGTASPARGPRPWTAAWLWGRAADEHVERPGHRRPRHSRADPAGGLASLSAARLQRWRRRARCSRGRDA